MRNFVNFILRVIATTLAIFGILFLTGIISISSETSEHTKETFTYVDGELCEVNSHKWSEIESLQGKLNINININETTELWSK